MDHVAKARGYIVSNPTTTHQRPSRIRRRKAIEGYLYISPFLVGFLIFSFFPVVASFALSMTRYAIIAPPNFVGLENYGRALSRDNLFWRSLGNTLYFAGLLVPFGLAGSLAVSLLLNQPIKGRSAFRLFFFVPSIIPVVAATLLWVWVFHPEFGLVNETLASFGVYGPKWLGSYEWAKPALILMGLWGYVGGSTMIIFLAGLQGIPEELYESAQIDGANAWHRFRFVTIPMLSPTIFLNLVLGLIGAFKVFTVAFIATNGGPVDATYFYVLHLFNTAFKYLEMGYASALAWIFLALVLGLTYLQVRWSRRWVYYAGEIES